MKKLLVLVAMVVLVAAPAFASDKEDAMAAVNQFVDSFNKGDMKAVVAACADQTSIIDEFPPYEWHGAGACSKWASDFDADAKKRTITEGVVTLSSPRHVDVFTGSLAYVVVPANYTYKVSGKTVKELGSMFTIVLKKGESGWRIVGSAWARN